MIPNFMGEWQAPFFSLAGWFYYGLGITIDPIVNILGYHLQTRLTPGILIDAWQRLAQTLEPRYD